MATVLDSVDIEYCHHHSKFYWTALEKSLPFTNGKPDSWRSSVTGPKTHSRSRPGIQLQEAQADLGIHHAVIFAYFHCIIHLCATKKMRKASKLRLN